MGSLLKFSYLIENNARTFPFNCVLSCAVLVPDTVPLTIKFLLGLNPTGKYHRPRLVGIDTFHPGIHRTMEDATFIIILGFFGTKSHWKVSSPPARGD